MNLKEAFRYQNFLSSFIQEALSHLQCSSVITRTTQEHQRSKVNYPTAKAGGL